MHTNNLDVIYFVQSGKDGPIKIGYTTQGSLRDRLSKLQTGNQSKMILLGIEIGDRSHETRLHQMFAPGRLRGEWFRPDNDLIAYIKTHATPVEVETKNAQKGDRRHYKPETTRYFAQGLQPLCTGTPPKSRLTSHGLRAFRLVRSARDARHLAGLSLSQVAERIETTIGKRYTTGAIANMENGKRRTRDGVFVGKRPQFKMTSDTIAVYRSSLAEAVTLATAGAIDVRITISKRGLWRVDPIMRCAICDHPFTVKRANVTRCNWCIRHKQTRRKESKR